MRQASFRVALLAVPLLALDSCGQQPYRVFATQVAWAPAATSAPGAPRVLPVSADLGGLHPSHNQWDLNQVPLATLLTLPEMDEATAKSIIAARPYKTKRDLLKRKILTAAQYARWKDYLVVHRKT